MPSTLYGIYNAQRSLSLNQAALDIINNNIANMNTAGYSKQRLEISQATNVSPYQNPLDASQSGLGAVVDSITRNRDLFLDGSVRKETTDLKYYEEYANNAIQIEEIIDELGSTGLNEALNVFYNSLSQLASHPDDYVIRSSVIQNAITLTTKFNNTYTQLQNARTGLVGDVSDPTSIEQSKLGIGINEVNSMLRSIANLNDKINVSTAQGMTPNALLDQRDQLLDKISEYIPVSIKHEKNNTVTLSLGTVQLVSGKEQTGIFSVQAGTAANPSIVQIKNAGGSTLSNDASSIITSGKLAAILQMGGSDPNKLTVSGLIDSLNLLASNFADAINTVQLNGRYIDDSATPHQLSNNASNLIDGTQPHDADPEAFFINSTGLGAITAGNITVNNVLINNPYQIAAADLSSGFTETGDGKNALAMSQVRNQNIGGAGGLGGTTTQGFITNIVGKLGTQSKSLQDNYDIKENTSSLIKQKRESITGVNLDEELADLIRFQRSYEASARVMTTLSETLSTIINMLG